MLRLITAVLLCSSLSLFAQPSSQTSFGDTLFSFNAGVLTPSPDRGLMGVEYFDGHFWVTGFNAPSYNHQLYKFSADGSTLVDNFSLGSGYHAYYDLAYDGQYLYATDRDSIVEIDPATGQITGGGFAVDFGYLLVGAIAYAPETDHFWVMPHRNGQLQIIYEMDRNGTILNTYPNLNTDYTTSLTWDSFSPGGPYLWTFSREEIGWDSRGIMRQFSPATGTFTGTEIEMTNRSPIVLDGPRGFAMTSEFDTTSISIVAIQAGAVQVTDGLDWLVAYNADLRGGGTPGPEISVNPTFINAQVDFGDSLEVPVIIQNNGATNLSWQAYAQSVDSLSGVAGDTLGAIDVVSAVGNGDTRFSGLTFARDHYWAAGVTSQGQKRLFKLDVNGTLVNTYPAGGIANQGWRAIASDGDHIFGIDTYSIAVWSIDSTSVVDNIISSSSADAMAYDPNNQLLLLGDGNGSIRVLDLQGNQVRFMITPYDIEGLAWDNFSPGGPFLWAWVDNATGFEAIRLNPETGISTGVSFNGTNYGSFVNTPEAAVIFNNTMTGNLVFAGLQEDNAFPGNEAFIAPYDLGVPAPPPWIKLKNTVVGDIPVGTSDTLIVSLHAIMSDTTTQATIALSSNALNDPWFEIPVMLVMQQSVLTGIGDDPRVAEDFVLGQNYPNPFNPTTTIRYAINTPAKVTLNLFDALGRKVQTLVSGQIPIGSYSVKLDATNLESGIYFYRLQAGNQSFTRKMLLIK